MSTPPFVALFCRNCNELRIGGPIDHEHVAAFARAHAGHDPRLLDVEDTRRVLAERTPKRATQGKDAPCLTS